MAIIKTYPLKSNYYGPDRLILSDMQPDSEGNVSGDTKNLTLSSLKSFIGGGAAVLQLTTQNTSGAATFDVNTNTLNVPVYTGDTYDLTALQKSGTSVPLKLNAASGTDSQVSFTEGANITLTRNSAEQITISATGGNAGVGSITNAFGTYIDGTTNTAATGAVGLGTIDLNAVNGTSDSSTRFLSKDNTWDVPSYTAPTTPAGSNTQFQYNNNGAFAGSSMLVLGTDEIVIGDTLTEQGKLRIEGNETVSGNIKIEGTTATKGVILSVQPAVSSDYNVVFPDTGPGGNNKILESDSSGNLAWISTPNVVGNPGGTATVDLSKITIGSTIYAIPTQGLTSVGLSAPPAFSVTGSPLTSNGSISIGVTGGSAGEFLAYNGQWATPTDTNSTYSLGTGASAGQIVLTGSNPTTSQTVTVAGTSGISITQFTSGTFNVDLGLATSSTRGGVKIGFAESGKNYPVELSSEKMFVNVPWTDTVYTLPEATATVRGGIELFSNTTQNTAANSVTTTANRTYGIQLNAANQAVVNVPWAGGTGSPAGVANNVQFSDGTSFSADVNFNWDASAEKLILGKDSTPQFQEGILRLLGDGQGGTAGTIEFQSAQGKSGGAAATVKLQGPVSGVTQEILLPDALPTANTQVLGIDTIVGTKVTTQWETPTGGSSSKLGFSPASIYEATHGITSETTGRTVWRASVVETDCTIDKVDFFVTAETGAVNLTVAVYVGHITSANRVLIGTSSALVTGVNTITFSTNYTFSAGDNIVIYTSQSGGEAISTIAGITVLNSTLLCRQSLSYSATPASSIAVPETGGDRVLSLHFYDE